MRRPRPTACLLLVLLPAIASAQQTTTDIVIDGTAESAGSLRLYLGAYATPCGTWFDATSGAWGSTSDLIVFGGDSGGLVALLLADALRNAPPIQATSNGNVLSIVTPLSSSIALHSVYETTDCGGASLSFLRLDGCTVANVLSTAPCDEDQAHVSGLRFIGGNRRGAPELPTDPVLTDTGGDPYLGPVAGSATETFNVSIDCTSAVAPGLYGFELRLGKTLVPKSTRLGSLYLKGTLVLACFASHTRSVESWFAPPGSALPPDPSLVGLTYHVQGFCGSIPPVGRLSNVLTQTIR